MDGERDSTRHVVQYSNRLPFAQYEHTDIDTRVLFFFFSHRVFNYLGTRTIFVTLPPFVVVRQF